MEQSEMKLVMERSRKKFGGAYKALADETDIERAEDEGMTVGDVLGPELLVQSIEKWKPPIATGVMDYFPDAMSEIATVSQVGAAQHDITPMRWDRETSSDEADSLMRHFMNRGTRDTDGQRHTAKVAWRALALLQKEIEDERS